MDPFRELEDDGVDCTKNDMNQKDYGRHIVQNAGELAGWVIRWGNSVSSPQPAIAPKEETEGKHRRFSKERVAWLQEPIR